MADDSQSAVPQEAAPSPAAPNMPPSWDKIAADPAFQAQPAEQRLKAKEAYFTQVIAPNIPGQSRTSLPDVGIHLEAYTPPYVDPTVDTQAVEEKNAAAAAHERLEKAYTSFMSYKPMQTGWGEFLTSSLPKDIEDFLPKLHASAKVANDAFNSSPGGAYQAGLVQQYLEDPSKLTAETRAAVAPVVEKYKQRQQISDADLAPLQAIVTRQAQRQLLETPAQRLISGAVETAPDIAAAAAGAYAGVPAPVTFSALQGLRSYADAKAKKLSDEDAIAHAGISTVVNGLTFPVAEATGGATGSLTGKVIGSGVSKVAGEKAGQAVGERAGAYVQQGTTMAGVSGATAGAQEIYDEYRAGKIDYKKLASVVGDEAAQGFVSGLAFGAGEHATGAATRGGSAILDAAGRKLAADSLWNEMGGAKKGGTTLDDLAPRAVPDTAAPAPATGAESTAKPTQPPATFNRGSRFEGAEGTPFEGITGTLVKAVDNPSGDRIWTVRAADGSLMQVPEAQMTGYQKPTPFVHDVGDKVVIGGDHHAAGAAGTIDDQIPTSQGPLYRIKTPDGQTLFAPEGQVHTAPRAALPAPGKPQEAATAALPVTREGQAVTPEQQAEQSQLGLSEDVRGAQAAHPAYPRPAEPITPRSVDQLDGKRALIAAGPRLTPDEHAVAANAEGVHPEDVPAHDVAALVAHFEADPAAAQKLVNAHESDTALAASARTAVEPAPGGAPENRDAAPGEPAQQPLGENGERSAGAPARAENTSKPGEPGSTEGQVGGEVRPPMPPSRAKAARPWINTDYNVPLGGGRDSPFRADGTRKAANERTTYIGKNIPEWEWEPESKRWINQWEEIDDHEIAEEKHLDELGYGGKGDAHDEHGNPATERNIKAQGAKVKDYNKIVQPHLDKERAVAESGQAQLPPDLDRRVYEKREFAKLLANASPEPLSPVTSRHRPSSLNDPLLEDEGSRRMLLGMADRAGWPEGKPGTALRADRQSEVVGRATTQSAERWFKDAQAAGGLPRNTDGSATRAAVTKALAGEPMSAAERRHVGTMLDHIRQDQEMAEMAGVLKDHELQPADAGLVSLIARAEDILGAQVVTELSDKHFGDDEAFRRALQEAIDEQRAPEETAGRGEGSGEPYALETHTEADLRARKAQEELADQQRREAEARTTAPSPEEFTLTGSSRDADVGAAAGQRGLFEKASEPASDGAVKKDGPKEPAFSRRDALPKQAETADRPEPKSVKELSRKLSDIQGREINVERVAPPNDTARAMANVVRRLFGRNVEFVRSDDAAMQGAYIGGKTLFVNADADRPHAQIIGHELLHSIRKEAPATYYGLVDSLRQTINRDRGAAFKTYLADLYKAQGLPRLGPEGLHEELIAEIVGDHFADPRFIRELQKNLEPNLFRRIAVHIMGFLDKLRSKLIGTPHELGRQAQRFVQDIEAAREAVKTALIELNNHQKESEGNAVVAPAFSREKLATPFYSALAHATEEMKGAPKKADAAAWKGWLDGAMRRGEFKGEERDWMGIDQFLDSHKGPITREELQDFVRANQVRVQDVEKIENSPVSETHKDATAQEVFGVDYAELEPWQRIDVDESIRAGGKAQGHVKFGQYQLPGGENYREHLLTLPAKDAITKTKVKNPPGWGGGVNEDEGVVEHGNTGADFRSGHWDEPNVLAHVRTNDRTGLNGEKILHVEEVQSDWHQKGRKQGYGQRLTPDEAIKQIAQMEGSTPEKIENEYGYSDPEDYVELAAQRYRIKDSGGVPDAPFKSSWPILAMKRMIRKAAEEGYDKITWTTGDQQAARYDLSKHINRIVLHDNNSRGAGKPRMDGPFDGGTVTAYDHSGKKILEKYVQSQDELAGAIGKEAAEKIVHAPPKEGNVAGLGMREKTLSGLDLKVGGEGMKAFYDKMLPNEVNKYVKKWDGKVGETAIDAGGVEQIKVHSLDITPAMRDAVLEGQPMFSRKETERPETRLPEDRTAESPIGRARNFADALLSATVKTFNPMATGSDRAQATAKDWANADRKARWRFQKLDEYAEKNFTPEQRQKMGEALDEMSVLTQSGAPTKGKGLNRLTPEERDYVERVNAMGAQVWQRAKDVGLVDGEGIPYYMPRSLVNVDDDGRVQRLGGAGEGGGRMPDRGSGMIKSSPNLRKRNYLLADDTEAAAKKKFGDGATLVTDIRALPLAMARLERAVAGRELINRIQDLGHEAGVENVTDSADPGYFTLNHPAFETFRPKVIKNDETGKYEAATDQNGNTIFDRVPLYVSKEFEGPLRALMWAQPGELEKALMQMKAISAGTIMYSPFIHLGVEFGRAFPAMPGKIVTMKFWRDGNMAKNNYQTMSQAIDDGLVPIGKRGAYQDLTSIASDPVLDKDKPAQSLFGVLGKGIARAVEKFNPQAADKMRIAQHALGEFYHNTLLWDRIGDMQMGLYTNMKEAFMRKGLDEQSAGRVAAHEANRFAGTLPREAMSQLSTRIANLTLFSRQFTLGNLGVLKDSLTGLPGDVQAQIMRDSGPLMRKAAVSLARRKAIGTVLIDIGLMVAMNSLLQDYFKHRMGDDQLVEGYRRRLHDALNNASEHPSQLFNPFYFPERLSSTWDNEPGKQDRIMVGHEKDGTAIYMRLPFGKIGEEFKNWMESPLKTATSKESTLLRPIIQTATNDKGFGRQVYNPEPQGLGDVAKNIGNIVMTFVSGMTPSDSIKSAAKLIDDSGKKVDGAKVLGPLVGLTFSSGAPGGPQVGELLQQEANQRSRMANELPQVNELIDAGKTQEAMKKLEGLGMSPKQAAIHIANREHKLVSRGRLKEFYQTATPEEIERYRRQMAASNELSTENQ